MRLLFTVRFPAAPGVIPQHRLNRCWPIDLEHITVALILKTDVKAGESREFIYSHIDSIAQLVNDLTRYALTF